MNNIYFTKHYLQKVQSLGIIQGLTNELVGLTDYLQLI